MKTNKGEDNLKPSDTFITDILTGNSIGEPYYHVARAYINFFRGYYFKLENLPYKSDYSLFTIPWFYACCKRYAKEHKIAPYN